MEKIVEGAIKDRVELDIARKRMEVKEGLSADKKIRQVKAEEELRRREIEKKYLDGVSYDRERVIGEIGAYLEQTVIGIIEAGKRLIAMKELEKRGEWIKIVEERIGISQPTAWRLMAIARKLANHSRVNDLRVLDLKHGVGKLYALLNVPDEELAEFDETGLFRGVTVEEINKMSVREFRKLIAEKEDWKARAKQLEMELERRYDTSKQWKEKVARRDEEIEELKKRLSSQGIPEEDEAALRKIGELKIQLRGLLRIIENSEPAGYGPDVQAELLSLAQYACDRGELCLGRVLEKLKGEDGRLLKEDAERKFYSKYGEEED